MPTSWLRSLALCLCATSAYAQLRLPAGALSKPIDTLERPLDDTISHTLGTLSDVRQLQIDRLVRADPRGIDTDPHGNPVVRSEVLALTPSEAGLARAQALNFRVAREQRIDELALRMVVLGAPSGMSTRKALKVLRQADPEGAYDFNHIYLGSGGVQDAAAPTSGARRADPETRVGLIDTGVALTHPAFRGSQLHAFGCDDQQVPAAHGTAVASLMVGDAPGFHGVAPGAALYAVDVYCGRPTGGALDAIVAAFGWLVTNQVPVINVSLVGPKNVLLERVVEALIGKGYLIVAAVGNDGPAAPPLYPASYPNVIGVTAVDAHQRALVEAARGPQVMFAAPGADTAAAAGESGFASVRGTSFAAPIVAALLAQQMALPDPAKAAAALGSLRRSALHVGKPGRDVTYGYGIVGMQFRADLAQINHP